MSSTRALKINLGLLTLRLAIGLGLFLLHGQAKLAGAWAYMFSGHDWPFVKVVAGIGFPAPGLFAVAAALSESLGSLLVAAGLQTRVAASFVAFTMIVATSLHVSHGQSAELAFLYLTPILTLMLTGGGTYSLDAAMGAPRLMRPELVASAPTHRWWSRSERNTPASE